MYAKTCHGLLGPIPTGSRAVRYLLRIWGEAYRPSDYVKAEIPKPLWQKLVDNEHLSNTSSGLAPFPHGTIRSASDVCIPPSIRWVINSTGPMPRKGSIPFDETWIKTLLANCCNTKTPFGKTMSIDQVIELINNIPQNRLVFESPALDYHFSKDILIENEKWVCPTIGGYKFKAGQTLKDKIATFLAVSSPTAKPLLQETLSSGWNPAMVKLVSPVWFQDHPMDPNESSIWDKECLTLIQSESVVQITREHVLKHGLPQVVLPMFLVEEKDKWRPIIDARYSNIALLPPWFSLPKIGDFCSLLSKDCFWFKCDVKSGWNHIPIDQHHSNFFAFQWKKSLYQYRICPFGDSSAPFAFTYLMITLKKMLKARGISDFILYIDDLLVKAGLSYQEASSLRESVIKTQLSLGLVLGAKKCPLPSKKGEALGFWIDTELGIVSFSSEKFDIIQKKIDNVKIFWENNKKVSARTLASLIGKIVSGCFLCKHTIGFLHPLIKILAEVTTGNEWDSFVLKDPSVLRGAYDWLSWCRSYPRRLWFNPKKPIFFSSDATPSCLSAVFWGNFPEFTPVTSLPTPVKVARRILTKDMEIAQAETVAISWGFRVLFDTVSRWLNSQKLSWNDVSIFWATDNQVCMYAFNKGVSSNLLIHNHVSSFLKNVVNSKGIECSWKYIPSDINFLADRISRSFLWEDEISFNAKYLKYLYRFCKNHNLPYPTSDAFASFYNKLFPSYYSKYHEEGSLGEFFSSHHDNENLWVFPPMDLVPMTISHILSNKLTAWVVIPWRQANENTHLCVHARCTFQCKYKPDEGPMLICVHSQGPLSPPLHSHVNVLLFSPA